MTDMTPAEQAAAEALCEKLGPTIGGFATPEPGDFEDEARAVIAAVRGIITAEAFEEATFILDEFAAKEERAPVTKTHMRGRTLASGIEAAASLIRKEANRRSEVTA